MNQESQFWRSPTRDQTQSAGAFLLQPLDAEMFRRKEELHVCDAGISVLAACVNYWFEQPAVTFGLSGVIWLHNRSHQLRPCLRSIHLVRFNAFKFSVSCLCGRLQWQKVCVELLWDRGCSPWRQMNAAHEWSEQAKWQDAKFRNELAQGPKKVAGK